MPAWTMGRRIFSLPRQVLSLPSRNTLMQRPRGARVARVARAARAARARLVDAVIRDGPAAMLPSMGHVMHCAYATVLPAATDPNAKEILIARHPTLLLGRVMGSWSRSGPRGYSARSQTVSRASSAHTNTVTVNSSSRLNMASRFRAILLR